MAFKLYASRHGVDFASPQGQRFEVVALKNGYHGDTLGVMDCAEASVFNEQQTPWYKARGLFLDPPTCGLKRGDWVVTLHMSLFVLSPSASTVTMRFACQAAWWMLMLLLGRGLS